MPGGLECLNVSTQKRDRPPVCKAVASLGVLLTIFCARRHEERCLALLWLNSLRLLFVSNPYSTVRASFQRQLSDARDDDAADGEATLRQNAASFERCDLVPNVLSKRCCQSSAAVCGDPADDRPQERGGIELPD
jgi:hypothetical protein